MPLALRPAAALAALVALLPFSVRADVHTTDARLPVAAAHDDTAKRLDAILDAPNLRHAVVGVLVRSVRDDRTVYERNADLALLPASNQKLLTAAAALTKLGPDFRFRTELLRAGRIDAAGMLRGDLVLRGGGDPSLTSERLGGLARDAYKAGLRRVTGRIIADDTRFDTTRLGPSWSWDNEPFAYQAQVSALNCDGNFVTLSVRPGPRAGRAGVVAVRPNVGYVSVSGRVATVEAGTGTKSDVVFDRTRARNELRVGGTIPVGAGEQREKMTVEDPARYAATRFIAALQAAGVRVPAQTSPAVAAAPMGSVRLAAADSEPLAALVRTFLKRSDNLYGETLFKTLGAVSTGKQGSWDSGQASVRAFAASVGLNPDGLSPRDGSGLSRQDAVTPRNLVALLTHVERAAAPDVRRAFVDALPVGGVDGTLEDRFVGTTAAGVVRAKTGSLTGVSCLSGYVLTRAGEPLAFSILMNSVLRGSSAARAAQDALVVALMDVPVARVSR